MSQSARTAIFGVTPLSLVLGRACSLGDCPPVGLYDPDPEAALRGALFLGISARQQPRQLDPPETPLDVALVGHQLALEGIYELDPRPGLLVLTLGPWPVTGLTTCQAMPIDEGRANLSLQAISASTPEIVFHLQGEAAEKERARNYLRALSTTFGFGDDQAL